VTQVIAQKLYECETYFQLGQGEGPMRRAQLPQAQLYDAWLASNGTLSQVLSDTMVTEALTRESRGSGAGTSKDVLSGLKTALLWSSAFWGLISLIVYFAA
jgi:hypothetical protein